MFAVVDNEIRWSNLARLKDQWEQQGKQKKASAGQSKTKTDGSEIPSYRVSDTPSLIGTYHLNCESTLANKAQVLAVPVYGLIKQILPSPNGAFLAIVTEHTVHISVLPDASHLSSTDNSPIRLKTYQLGPTTHVIPEAPVVSALWHPLGLHTNLSGCIVTVTADSAVRVWELDRNNHWSFDQPTLAVDLKKLIDGTSSDQDFTPSKFSNNKGFSADIIDMEASSACFAGNGDEREDAWAPMTLWVAMRPGDLYALCPLLPSKWQAPSTTIPSLSAANGPKLAALRDGAENQEEQLAACRQQFEWLREIDNQVSLEPSSESGAIEGADVYTRPVNPSAIPRLQGPFRFDYGEEVDDLDLCDILVIAAKLDVEDLMEGEDEQLAVEVSEQDKLSATVICLSSANGRVHVCLELDGVEGQWLPKTARNSTFQTPWSEPSDMILVESLDTLKSSEASSPTWPTFTKDVLSRYSFFVTTASNVVSFSMSSWAQRLEAELQTEDTSGSEFRLGVICGGDIIKRQRILQVSEADVTSQKEHLAASLLFYDFDLGYLLITYHPSNPYAAIMDAPEESFSAAMELYEHKSLAPGSPIVPPRRAPYQVPAVLYANSPLDSFVEKHVPHRQRHTLKENVRMSPATLDLVTTAHRVLSAHTNALERAASDLFRRCERLQGEMQDQLKQLSDVAERIKGVTSEIDEDGNRKEAVRDSNALDKRVQAARDKQDQLVQRYDALRKKVLNSGGRPLSEKEKSWVAEVNTLSESFDDGPSKEDEDENHRMSQRLGMVRTNLFNLDYSIRSTNITQAKRLALDLLAETKSIAAKVPSPSEPGSPASPVGSQPKVPQRLQRAKIADAMKMVERE